MECNTVTIAPQLYRHVAALVEKTGAFDSVDEYVNFVLSELFSVEDPRQADRHEEEMLRQRLEQLGYM